MKRGSIEWLLDRYETSAKRYMDAETFIIDTLLRMPWYERLFLNTKILTWYTEHARKYDKNSMFQDEEIYKFTKMGLWERIMATQTAMKVYKKAMKNSDNKPTK